MALPVPNHTTPQGWAEGWFGVAGRGELGDPRAYHYSNYRLTLVVARGWTGRTRRSSNLRIFGSKSLRRADSAAQGRRLPTISLHRADVFARQASGETFWLDRGRLDQRSSSRINILARQGPSGSTFWLDKGRLDQPGSTGTVWIMFWLDRGRLDQRSGSTKAVWINFLARQEPSGSSFNIAA